MNQCGNDNRHCNKNMCGTCCECCNQYKVVCDNNPCSCNNDCCIDCSEYKDKSDELYHQALYVKEKAQKLLEEVKKTDCEARDLEKKAKQLCSQAKCGYEKVKELENEYKCLMEMSSFYAKKSADCNKNISLTGCYTPSCDKSCYCKSDGCCR